MNKKELLYKIQKYNFAAYDLLLYLDTHPEDRNAFAMFKAMVKDYKDLVKSYETAYGPLEAYSAAGFDTFRWTESPWPWEKEANV
ncbi:MAG: spore coat protein CotJB [Clostridia bacterium]|nr:spore coat protein CotJB [Clostridia bacterium]